jgi:hypothetical protein
MSQALEGRTSKSFVSALRGCQTMRWRPKRPTAPSSNRAIEKQNEKHQGHGQRDLVPNARSNHMAKMGAKITRLNTQMVHAKHFRL